MSAGRLPLHELFEALREAGLPLGVSDYLAALSALRMGEGGDRESLLRLCRMLWTSSVDEGLLLERLFHDLLPPPLRDTEVPAELRPPEPPAGAPGAAAERASPEPAAAALEPRAPDEERAPPSRRAVEIASAAVQGSTARLDLAMAPQRLAVGEYLPVTARQLGQSWRRLRRMEARGPATELDVPGTIADIARKGTWTGPVLAARKLNVAGLLLLVDRDGSMTPFHPLTRRIVASALHGSNLPSVVVAHFHNYAAELVELESGPVPLSEVLGRLPPWAGALFVGDAGAARRTCSTETVEGVRRMIARVGARLDRVAWINPVPRRRWPGTSAQDVELMVPMFEATRAGFDAALRVLRGRRPFAHGPVRGARP